MKLSRSSILFSIVAVVLLSALPGAIRRLAQTGDPYLFTEQFFHDMVARLTGPGKLRFIIQPAVAVIIGIRHGVKDVHANLPPFLWVLAFHASHRQHALRTAVVGVRDLVAVAILLDIISQALIFHHIYPGAALLVGPVLISFPYSLARELANRVIRARRPRATAAGSA
jgi:hypothetical protein